MVGVMSKGLYSEIVTLRSIWLDHAVSVDVKMLTYVVML